MASTQSPPLKLDRYVVIHVATTCDEHGVYVTKDSAELIELGWILLDAHNLEEVSQLREALKQCFATPFFSCPQVSNPAPCTAAP